MCGFFFALSVVMCLLLLLDDVFLLSVCYSLTNVKKIVLIVLGILFAILVLGTLAIVFTLERTVSCYDEDVKVSERVVFFLRFAFFRFVLEKNLFRSNEFRFLFVDRMLLFD